MKRSRILTALGMAGFLLLAACSSGTSSGAKPATTRGGRSATSSTRVDPTSSSTTATPASVVVTTSPAPAGVKGACSLVTRQEVGTALGADPGPPTKDATHTAVSCLYGTMPSIVSVDYLPARGKADYERVRAQAPAGRVTDVAGVGDAAFAVSSGRSAQIEFYKGDAFVAVGVLTGRATSPPKDQALALAKIAAARL